MSSLLRTLIELGYDVTFLHVRQERGDEEAMRQTWGDAFTTFDFRRPRQPLLTRIKHKLLDPISVDVRYTLNIDEWYDPALDHHLARMHRAQPYHSVIASYVFFSRALLNFDSNVTRIIDTHDAFANRHRQYLAHGETPKWFSTTPAGERKAMDRADLVFAIQDRERMEFSRLTRTPVVTLGHITPVDPLDLSLALESRILFVASKNAINVHGIRHFIDHIFPAVRNESPSAELAIAGSVCQSLTSAPGVELLGRVDDLRAMYATASIVINPVQFKTGVAIKNLEALGYGKPLVTAAIGSEGMEAGRDTAFLAADTDEQFAKQVVEVLGNPARATALSKEALLYIRRCNQDIRDKLVRAIGSPILA